MTHPKAPTKPSRWRSSRMPCARRWQSDGHSRRYRYPRLSPVARGRARLTRMRLIGRSAAADDNKDPRAGNEFEGHPRFERQLENGAEFVIDAEKARLRLAEALLSISSEDGREVDVLKRAALQRMALDYKRRR
jgi:hypothetical protein